MGRLAKLEGEHRRFKRLGSLALVALAAVGLMGQARGGGPKGAKSIEAEHFLVRDESGTIRGGLGINPQGGVGVWFNGQTKVSMGVGLDGRAGMRLTDDAGKLRGAFALQPDGLAGIEIRDVG